MNTTMQHEPVGEIVEDTSILRAVYEDGRLVEPNKVPSKPRLYMGFGGEALAIGTKLFTEPPIASELETKLRAELNQLQLKIAMFLLVINEYHKASTDCNSCSAMLLSNGLDPEPARLMAAMFAAREKMFSLASTTDTTAWLEEYVTERLKEICQ